MAVEVGGGCKLVVGGGDLRFLYGGSLINSDFPELPSNKFPS